MTANTENTNAADTVANEASDLTYGIALINRLTESVVGFSSTGAELNADRLIESFGIALYEFLELKKKLKNQLSELEIKCREEERTFCQTLTHLRNDVSGLHEKFNALDKQVHMVSGKLVHLGDELDRKRLPCRRIAEASASILEFFKIIGAGGGTAANMAVSSSGSEDQLIDAATRVNHLHALCLELPNDEHFLLAKQQITVTREQLGKKLLEKFKQACLNKDSDLKKRIVDVLSNTTGTSPCTEAVIEEALMGIDIDHINFNEITTKMAETEQEIITLFSHPDTVVTRLIYTLFKQKIKRYLDRHIPPTNNLQQYLENLYREYVNIKKLLQGLSDQLTLVTDPAQLSGLFHEHFEPYLSGYIKKETEWLDATISEHLEDFYAEYNHKKRNVNKIGSSLKDLQVINSKQKESEQDLEGKINLGLERCINLIIRHIQQFLPSDSRGAEFQPNDSACRQLEIFFREVVKEVREHLDGDNLNSTLKEIGIRFKDAVIDHLTSFTFSVDGGLRAMQNVAAYGEAVDRLNDPSIKEIFISLTQLMNLTAIAPENIRHVIQDYRQMGYPTNILMQFLQLRKDYKSAKLDVHFK